MSICPSCHLNSASGNFCTHKGRKTEKPSPSSQPLRSRESPGSRVWCPPHWRLIKSLKKSRTLGMSPRAASYSSAATQRRCPLPSGAVCKRPVCSQGRYISFSCSTPNAEGKVHWREERRKIDDSKFLPDHQALFVLYPLLLLTQRGIVRFQKSWLFQGSLCARRYTQCLTHITLLILTMIPKKV